MLVPLNHDATNIAEGRIRASVFAEEQEFYEHYSWCLDPNLTFSTALAHLKEELDKLSTVSLDWQRREVAINVYLLSCGILNATDEHLSGRALRLPTAIEGRRPFRAIQSLVRWITAGNEQTRRWRDVWLSALDEFVPVLLAENPSEHETRSKVSRLVRAFGGAPDELADTRIGIPSPFQRLDMTHLDVVALGRRLIQQCPDRAKPLVLIGLRTSGTYFAPLIKAMLRQAGYGTVSFATLEPNKEPSRREEIALRQFASQGHTGVIVDDPPYSGGTLIKAIEVARKAGFQFDDLAVLVPTHWSNRDWQKNLPKVRTITLLPEDWHKSNLLGQEQARSQIATYFDENARSVSVFETEQARQYAAQLKGSSPDQRVGRLKRVYEVHIETLDGHRETVFVLAKSVGWGWLSYHAFLAASRLADFVPPLFGLRQGILYTRYIPQMAEVPDRRACIDTIAEYVAARTRHLALADRYASAKSVNRHNNGRRLLEKALSRAYGTVLTDILMRARIGARLQEFSCAAPTWIDGNMTRSEWIAGPDGWIKTDFEHHGMGKGGLNVIDPAFDLSDAVLNFQLDAGEERRLIERYVEMSGDASVERRLFINKLLAGVWNMNRSQERIWGSSGDREELQQAHNCFIAAWDFLTLETAHYCGRLYERFPRESWRGPIVALDVDGVIDRRLFGFPATTAAGLRALHHLTTHNYSVVLNTARSVAEVKTYCEAYSLAGGIAEYGSYLWDAVQRRGRVLVDPESIQQLETLRAALRRIPGVFLDNRHLYSIRAFTYRTKPDDLLSGMLGRIKRAAVGEGAVGPLSPLLVQQIIAERGLDRLRVHQTTIDTTIIAREVDKGVGLVAMRDWVLRSDGETIAVGDSEADLAMFRVADRSFAPGNISCAGKAKLAGCQIVPQRYQRGLLEIVHRITGIPFSSEALENWTDENRFMMQILEAADQPAWRKFIDAMRHPSAFRIFLR
jgi:hydroxymethylpyrimidine pyrophosphatase-like HAD family hydrolase/orotate phosphoribosyltransferase